MEQDLLIAPIGVPGTLSLPAGPKGIVVFAHGSGSSHASPRNRTVAAALNRAGFGTLLFDLLTPVEAEDRANVFDVHRLSDRLLQAIHWLAGRSDTAGLPVGLFGASTGAAAALIAAARAAEHDHVRAVVSRGGRPDLAEVWIAGVAVPTLLIVGGNDAPVIGVNRTAYAALHAVKDLVVIPGAGHLFEEPDALEAVTAAATAWFTTHLAAAD